MPHNPWTEEQVQILLDCYPYMSAIDVARRLGFSVRRVYQKANHMKIHKSEQWLMEELQRQGKRLRIVGKDARFQKGNKPHNTGKPWQQWLSEEGRKNSLTTAFKKGNLPHNTRRDGDVSIRTDKKTGRQYKFIRIGLCDWRELHRVIWIFVNGMIPPDKILRCRTEDTLNCDPSNWVLSDRKTHLAKNTGRENMSDKYIALIIARRDPQLRDALMQMPEVLDLKRTELNLKNTIYENA